MICAFEDSGGEIFLFFLVVIFYVVLFLVGLKMYD